MKLRSAAGKESKYFYDFTEAKQKLVDHTIRGQTYQELFTSIMDAMFIFGMVDRSSLLEKQIGEEMTLPVWRHSEELIRVWGLLLNAKSFIGKGMKSDEGALVANSVQVSERRRAIVANAAYAGRAEMQCYNCGEKGHSYSKCTKPQATCDKCEGRHHSVMHDKVRMMMARRDVRPGPAKSLAHSRSPAAQVARREANQGGQGTAAQQKAYALHIGMEDASYDDLLDFHAQVDEELAAEADKGDFGDRYEDDEGERIVAANMACMSFGRDWEDADGPN